MIPLVMPGTLHVPRNQRVPRLALKAKRGEKAPVTRGHSSFVRLARLAFALPLVLIAVPAGADPADIDAAARGVVRIVLIANEGGEMVPISHGTGFAISPERIVTNAHVVAEAREAGDISIGIVPSDGVDAVYARLVAYAPRADLALLATTSDMKLPPLALSGALPTDSSPVTAVGYPMNVERAQGLSTSDVFRAQPPVKSTGFLAGSRPTREFDSLLHTAPIARGNSGGPLLDNCGRVIGVNSFGAETGGADAEFFFAVSTRELLNFLREANVTPQVNGMPCRSLADLDADEARRSEREQLASEARQRASAEETARRSDLARRDIEFALFNERDNRAAIAFLLIAIAFTAGGAGWLAHERGHQRNRSIAGSIALVAIFGAGWAWIARPGFDQIEDRLLEHMTAEVDASANGAAAGAKPGPKTTGNFMCVLDAERSRVTSANTDDLPFEWSKEGCVNKRTQYGLANGEWSRVFVPDDEASVMVNRFDPESGEYRIDRYLLNREAMTRARQARSEYQAPACNAGGDAATELGARQTAIRSLLPERPNERLVYNCKATAG